MLFRPKQQVYKGPDEGEERDHSLVKLPLFKRWLAKYFLLRNLSGHRIKVDVYDEKQLKFLKSLEFDASGNVLTGTVATTLTLPVQNIRIPQHQELYLSADPAPVTLMVEISSSAMVEITVLGDESKKFGKIKVRGGRLLTLYAPVAPVPVAAA